MTSYHLNRIKEVLVWLHTHSTVYEIIMEDFDGDPFMGYYDRNASDISDTLHQILDKKDIKYKSDMVLKAVKYEREHPELAIEIDEYINNNDISQVFP